MNFDVKFDMLNTVDKITGHIQVISCNKTAKLQFDEKNLVKLFQAYYQI